MTMKKRLETKSNCILLPWVSSYFICVREREAGKEKMCAHDQRSCFLLACLASLHACLLAASNGSGNTMNSKSLEQAKNLVKSSYISQGDQALNGRKKVVGSMKIPNAYCCCRRAVILTCKNVLLLLCYGYILDVGVTRRRAVCAREASCFILNRSAGVYSFRIIPRGY